MGGWELKKTAGEGLPFFINKNARLFWRASCWFGSFGLIDYLIISRPGP
jgi:hypothetical protein